MDNIEKQDKELFFKENINLVYYIANKMYSPHGNQEDRVQEGMIGLWYAVNHFDSTKGYEFSTYACECIRGYILVYIKRFECKSFNINIDDLANVLVVDDMFENIDNNSYIDSKLSMFSKEEKEFMLSYLSTTNMKEKQKKTVKYKRLLQKAKVIDARRQ